MKAVVIALFGASVIFAQGMGSSGAVAGTVTDPTGLVVAGATVQLLNRGTGFDKAVQTDNAGAFRFVNLAPQNYHLQVTAPGFQTYVEDMGVRAGVPVNKNVTLNLAQSTSTIEVKEDPD